VWLILSHEDDASARWAYGGLKERGLAPLELLTAEMLGPTLRWNHRLGADGPSIEISLPDGRVLTGHSLRGVLNRLRRVTGWRQLRGVGRDDRSYAEQEIAAFFLSWLACLPPPVLNRATPQGLAGPRLHASEWTVLATAAGLATAPFRQSSRNGLRSPMEDTSGPGRPSVDSVLVVDRRAFGPAPPNVLHACKRLAELAGASILGVDFTPGAPGPWTFAHATPVPDLRTGGEAGLDALAEALLSRREVR